MERNYVEAWCSGICHPRNPGGFGVYAIKVAIDGKEHLGRVVCVGSGNTISNNVAVYCGIMDILQYLQSLGSYAHGVIRTDSEVAAMQLNGQWTVNKHAHYSKFARDALALFGRLGGRFKAEYVPASVVFPQREMCRQKLQQLGVPVRFPRTAVMMPKWQQRMVDAAAPGDAQRIRELEATIEELRRKVDNLRRELRRHGVRKTTQELAAEDPQAVSGG
jgi:ribonuclease HI